MGSHCVPASSTGSPDCELSGGFLCRLMLQQADVSSAHGKARPHERGYRNASLKGGVPFGLAVGLVKE